eukprot:3533039-Prymnesium_polylepis.1
MSGARRAARPRHYPPRSRLTFRRACRLSLDSSSAACSSRTGLGCCGSPRRSSELGSLFTLLPEPEASSLACATGLSHDGATPAGGCSGERSRSAASADAVA